jgi:hypothetical protein
MRYDRVRASLDQHTTCIVAAYVAGAARLQPVSLPPGSRHAVQADAGVAQRDPRSNPERPISTFT